MSEHQVTALRYEVQQVGKHIKSTKKRYFWALSIGPRCYNFILDDSLVSGKSKLSINGKVFHQTQESGLNRCRYDHSFVIDGCLFNISEVQDGYEMRVDNKLFSHMLNKEMTKSSFEEHRVDEGDFQLAGRIKGENKKITLSLPGMGNGMKKKKTGAVQSENWGEFAGSTSFPNYFGESQTKKTAENVTVPQEVSLTIKEEPSSQQFSTLQNLFKTINACGEYVPKATEGATPTYDISEIPVIPEINLQEFTTMQQLFATVSGQSPKVEEKPAVQTKVDDFNTMQNLFTTLKFPQAQKNEAAKVSASVPKVEDFNTMQNLFSTLKPANQPLSSIPQDISKVNLADFSTLQNLFATGVPISVPVQKQPEEEVFQTAQSFASTQQTKPQKQPDFSKINVNDFNTMQNLFATNANPARDVLGNTDKANKAEQPTKTETSPNQFDFNTMQNLFATTSGKTQKNENKFWQF